MEIDILDDYIQTPEWFRGLSDIYRSTGDYRWAYMGLSGEEEGRPGQAARPLPL